jgi:hypothetical protein
MSIEIVTRSGCHKGKRYRCDSCKKLIKHDFSPFIVKDTVTITENHLCSPKCRDDYWGRYQLSLYPCSNTGVISNKTCPSDGGECVLDCQNDSHCMVAK